MTGARNLSKIFVVAGLLFPSPLRAQVADSTLALGQAVFLRQCAPCHGKSGKGDGPAAIVFNPRPADLTDPNGIGMLSDDQILETLRHGRLPMPAFEKLLSDVEIRAVLSFVRSLGSEGWESARAHFDEVRR